MVTDPAGQELTPNWGKGGIKARLRENVSIRPISVNSVEKDATEKFDKMQPDYFKDLISCKNFKNLVNNLAAKRSLNDDTSNNKKKNKKKYDARNNFNPEDIPLFDRMEKIFSNNEQLIDFSQFDNPNYKMKAKIVNKNLTEALIKKCKELKIELTLEELATVSPVVRKCLNEEFEVKRVAEVKKVENSVNSVKLNSEDCKSDYLAVGSRRKIGIIQEAEIEVLFDEGSNVNLMSIEVYKALESLGRAKLKIDIKWQMRNVNSGKLRGVK
ncbi:hypothetical protein AYI70_g6482 [Smittium culicis]|uniref:Uncharacterized protein n=1 Tax=Smittium culicis TaxID=133412 RepID=A0A1R1XPV2_9FUNG|nr:hypothetical protein AYI70_g6482 [Smittium culicis]